MTVAIVGSGCHAKMLAVHINEECRFYHSSEEIPDDMVVINGIGNVAVIGNSGLHLRRSVFNKHISHIGGVAHKTAVLAGTVDKAVQVMALAVINANAHVGDNTIINTGAIVEHDCKIGKHCHVAPGVVLCGGVVVGDLSHIGAGSVVLQNITVGTGCVVAAGSVVTRDVPDGMSWLKGNIL